MSFEISPNFLLNFSGDDVKGDENYFYEFKSFRLNIAERQLLNNGVSVPLMPKVFDVLVYLVERSGHLVEKEELLRTVWADSFVEEANIARIIYEIRKILGEDKNGDKFIETVAKKGYRFIADVTIVSKEDSAAANGFDKQIDIPRNKSNEPLQTPVITDSSVSARKNTTRIILIFVGILSVISLIFSLAFNRQSEAVNSNAPKSIAVLPLKPVNINDRDLIYELGIAESLIFKFSSIKGLKVRPLSATRKYADIEQDATAAGREQQVDYVLASNYQIADDKIRVTSRFINIRTGSVEALFKSETNTANKFSMQDAIVNDIGNPLSAQFGNAENNLTVKRGTNNEEAYRLYLKAQYIFEEWNEPKIGEAIECLEQAVKLDPNFAAAYVSLAYAYQTYQWIWRYNIPSENEYYFKSKEAVEKALALDENSADGHAVLGLVKSGYERDFAGAEKEYLRAIELNPESGMAHGLYAMYLVIYGRFDEALAEQEKAIAIDPTYVVNDIAYGMILYDARRYPEASAHFKKMLEKEENIYNTYHWLWVICAKQDNETEAYEWFIKYQTQIKTDPEIIKLYQTAFQKFGWKGILRENIKQDEKIATINGNPDLLYEIACFNAELGNKDQAFEYLEKAYERRRSSLNYIIVDPSLDSLHNDPRFDKLVQRIGLN